MSLRRLRARLLLKRGSQTVSGSAIRGLRIGQVTRISRDHPKTPTRRQSSLFTNWLFCCFSGRPLIKAISFGRKPRANRNRSENIFDRLNFCCSGGTSENSPAIYRRGQVGKCASPAGTADAPE